MATVSAASTDEMLSLEGADEAPKKGRKPSAEKGQTRKAAEPKAPRDPNAKPPNATERFEGVWVDSEGYGLTKKGERDRRWRNADGSLTPLKGRTAKVKGESRAAGVTRRMKMENLFAPRPEGHPEGQRSWAYVRQGYSNEAIHGASGAQLKKYFVIRNEQTGEEVTVGEGELRVYAKMSPPLKPRGTKKASGAEDGFAEGEEGTDNSEFLPDNA